MKKRFPAGIVLLFLALALTSGLALRAHSRAGRLEARLREVYDGAVLSALRQMEDMELALSKALLSQGREAEARYLNQVSVGAAQVQRSLSLLPLAHTATQSAVKLANQLTDYSAVLLRAGALSEKNAADLTALLSACREYAAALHREREALSAKALAGKDLFYPAAPEENAPAYDSAVSYPTLIYDGPFSDARTAGPALALGPRRVTQEEALAIARDFVGEDRVLRASPGADMGGNIPCWGVELRLKDVNIQAAVTKQGGKMLWMAPDSGDFPAEKSVEECRENALQFLSARGFEHMQATYFQAYEGVAVISFAATQGTTLLYPDLIKVQLRMDTGAVVGLEARNYLQNHGPRGLLTPSLTQEEARERVGSRLRISSCRLCLIPTDRGERLCYEFQGAFSGDTYLAYINALDGGQEELLKVVEGETGLEAV